MAKITRLKCEFLRNVWIVFHNSKWNLLRKGSNLISPNRFIEICLFFMSWKSTNFLYPLSKQERERDNPHKILKRGSLHWVIIRCYEILKLGLVTELYMQKWSDNLFTQVVYMLSNHMSNPKLPNFGMDDFSAFPPAIRIQFIILNHFHPQYWSDMYMVKIRLHRRWEIKFRPKCTHKTEIKRKNGRNQLRLSALLPHYIFVLQRCMSHRIAK